MTRHPARDTRIDRVVSLNEIIHAELFGLVPHRHRP